MATVKTICKVQGEYVLPVATQDVLGGIKAPLGTDAGSTAGALVYKAPSNGVLSDKLYLPLVNSSNHGAMSVADKKALDDMKAAQLAQQQVMIEIGDGSQGADADILAAKAATGKMYPCYVIVQDVTNSYAGTGMVTSISGGLVTIEAVLQSSFISLATANDCSLEIAALKSTVENATTEPYLSTGTTFVKSYTGNKPNWYGMLLSKEDPVNVRIIF